MPVTPVRQLYELQGIDSRLAQLERTLAGLDDSVRLRTLAEQARAEEEAAAGDLKAKQARLRVLELELQTAVDKARKVEQDLYGGRVSNPKELTAMQDDVAALGRQRRRIEDEMLGWNWRMPSLCWSGARSQTSVACLEMAVRSRVAISRTSRDRSSGRLSTPPRPE